MERRRMEARAGGRGRGSDSGSRACMKRDVGRVRPAPLAPHIASVPPLLVCCHPTSQPGTASALQYPLLPCSTPLLAGAHRVVPLSLAFLMHLLVGSKHAVAVQQGGVQAGQGHVPHCALNRARWVVGIAGTLLQAGHAASLLQTPVLCYCVIYRMLRVNTSPCATCMPPRRFSPPPHLRPSCCLPATAAAHASPALP